MDANKKRIVLVTGASSGIGRETALLLHGSGYKVYGAARRTDRMADLAEKGITVLELDVTNEDSMKAAVSKINEIGGGVDILINNAGFGLYGVIEDVPIEDAKAQFEVNLFGLARMTQLVLPHMREQRWGKIVNISSIAGKMAAPLGGWYHSSKFAVEGLSDSLRNELRPFGIDVIIIEPGGIKTEWAPIAIENLKRNSKGSAYEALVEKSGTLTMLQKNGSEPIVIARLIKKVIEKKRPRERYSKGYLSSLTLFGRKWLGDRAFDWVMKKFTGM